MRSKRAIPNPSFASLICGFLVVLAVAIDVASAQEEDMRQYQLAKRADSSGYDIVLTTVERPSPGPNQVLVRVRATSLNGGLDVEMLKAVGEDMPDFSGRVPLSDAAGEVVEVGDQVSRFSVGDRVVTTYVPEWIDGPLLDEYFDSIRGISADGVLAELIAIDEQALVAMPGNLGFEEAATLPVAGVTAWVSLFRFGGLVRGDYVLLEGTGGVSSFGLVFSVAADARPIITSSSDVKLERAKSLGAIGTVNYRVNPEWQDEVRALTNGAGVQHVLEVGGRETLEKALSTLGYNGHAALIGMLTGFYEQIPALPILNSNGRLTAVYVGSRADFEAMNAFIEEHDVRPVIDRVFQFEDAPAAFERMATGDYMGKIVIGF